ncbi:MAG TPA: ABC transporter substrate-binding protein [Rhizobiaceae bacterium]|nr:ABC transporter substrate-binding protein [Rhizobiaceae bacterium]
MRSANGRKFLTALLTCGVAALSIVPTASVALAQEKVVRMQKYADARSLDPHKLMTRSISELAALLTDTLVSIEDDLKTVGHALAKEWTVSEDGLTYTFTLKDNLRFCDGKALTAKSVVASFDRWRAPETQSINTVLLGSLETVTALDDKTVQFKLATASDQFLVNLASPYAGIIDAEEAAALGDDFGIKHINGSGPYCWESRRPREITVLTKNPHFTWGNAVYENPGPPAIDRFEFVIMPEDNARVAAMLTGESDASYYLPLTSIAQFANNPDFEIVEPRAFGYLAFIGTKLNRPLMEPAVRKAMNYAIDREALVEVMYAGYGKPAASVLSPTFEGYNAKVEQIEPTYDPDEAGRILDEAGWVMGSDGVRVKDGVRLAPKMIGHNPWRARLEAIQGMLREVGIDVQLDITDSPIATSRILTQSDYDMYGWYASYTNTGELMQKYFSPGEPYSPFSAVPEQGAELGALISEAAQTLDTAKRMELYGQAQVKIAEQNLWIPLVHDPLLVVYNKKKITGVKPHGLYAGGFYKGIDLAIPE